MRVHIFFRTHCTLHTPNLIKQFLYIHLAPFPCPMPILTIFFFARQENCIPLLLTIPWHSLATNKKTLFKNSFAFFFMHNETNSNRSKRAEWKRRQRTQSYMLNVIWSSEYLFFPLFILVLFVFVKHCFYSVSGAGGAMAGIRCKVWGMKDIFMPLSPL